MVRLKDIARNSVANPGFPREDANLLLYIIFAENCMKMKKNWTERSARGNATEMEILRPIYTKRQSMISSLSKNACIISDQLGLQLILGVICLVY